MLSSTSRRTRARSPGSSEQSRPPKRPRYTRIGPFHPPLLANRPNASRSAISEPTITRLRPTSPQDSTSSSQASASQYYGVGDDGVLENIFAAYPQTLSTLPRPQGWNGLNEPEMELRFDREIYLSRNFPRGRRRSQRIRAAIPGREVSRLGEDLSPQPALPQPIQPVRNTPSPPTATKAQFEKALKLVRDVVGEGRRLTIQLAQSYERVQQWRERWGWSPLSDNAYDSPPPPYSPPQSSLGEPSQVALSESARSLPQESSIAEPIQTVPLESALSSPGQQSSSPPPDIIPNPPIPGDPFPTLEALVTSVNTFAKAHGFGVTKYNVHSYKGRKNRLSLQCDRYGQPGPHKGVGLRKRKSRKCGCKWMVIGEAIEEGRWLLRQHPNPEHHEHNHKPTNTPSAHPSHRRLTSPIRSTIEITSRRLGIRARDVRAITKEQHPETNFTQRDIYNARADINRDKLGGHSPTGALVKLLDENNIPYIAKWADDQPSRLVGLVWTFPYCLDMWKRFPECISFDNTYNTNRFKLPLFQATGQTCLGTVFNAAFGLIDNERREGFQFLAEGIKQLVEKHSIRQPTVIITDFDDAMKAALNDQFPDAQQQLCIHHINSNVILRAKQKWLKLPVSSSSSDSSTNEEDPASQSQAMLSAADKSLVNSTSTDDIPHTYQGVLIMWKSVLFAETEETHEKAWKALCKEFMDQRPILRYLFGTYMPVRLQWARCYIRWFQNFGIRVTSGTEASNNNVKSYLLNGMSHLYRLVEAMQDMLKDQERDFRDACANDEVLTDRAYLGSSSEYLGELRTVVSSKGLMLIHRQYLIARKAMPTGKTPYPEPLGPCDNNCSVSIELGIPCSHKVHARIMSNAPFTKWDVHPRWRLRPSSSRNPYQRILDPKIATSLRGRPRNTAQTIPARMAIDASSHFADFQPSQPSGRKRGRPKGSRNKSTLTRIESLASQASPGFSSQVTATSQPAISQANVATQPLLRSQSRVLGAGNTTGVRASGRRTQPSIRRTKSQWEMLEQIDGEDVFDSIVVRE